MAVRARARALRLSVSNGAITIRPGRETRREPFISNKRALCLRTSMRYRASRFLRFFSFLSFSPLSVPLFPASALAWKRVEKIRFPSLTQASAISELGKSPRDTLMSFTEVINSRSRDIRRSARAGYIRISAKTICTYPALVLFQFFLLSRFLCQFSTIASHNAISILIVHAIKLLFYVAEFPWMLINCTACILSHLPLRASCSLF